MTETIVKLTGLPVSREMQSILERLAGREYVSLDEINATREMKTALSNIDYSRPSIQLDNRQDLQKGILRKMNQFGSAVIDGSGETEYTGNVDKNSRLDIIIGLPASGKSSAIVDVISQEFHSKLVDNDEAKKMIPQYNDGWGASVVHEESQVISDFAFRTAIAQHENIVLPKVGSDARKLEKEYIQPAKKNGYSVYVHFVDVPREIALGRMLNRFIEEGRFLEPRLIDKYANEQEGNKIEQAYDMLKHSENLIDGCSRWDNDVARGERPFLMETRGLDGNFINNARVKEKNNEQNEKIDSRNSGGIREGGGSKLPGRAPDGEGQRADNRGYVPGRSHKHNDALLHATVPGNGSGTGIKERPSVLDRLEKAMETVSGHRAYDQARDGQHRHERGIKETGHGRE